MGGAKELILVVDDEPAVLRLCSSVLGSAGFRLLVAESAEAALEIWEPRRGEIALVLADVAMPKTTGLAMAARMFEIDPGVRILFMSAYSEAAAEAGVQQRFPFLRKPFLPEDLLRKVQEIVGPPLLS